MIFQKTILVSVVEAIGSLCSTREDGAKMNRMLTELLNQGYSVRLNFRGVRLVTPSFYAVAIADLYCSFPDTVVSSQVTFSDMPPPDLFPSSSF